LTRLEKEEEEEKKSSLSLYSLFSLFSLLLPYKNPSDTTWKNKKKTLFYYYFSLTDYVSENVYRALHFQIATSTILFFLLFNCKSILISHPFGVVEKRSRPDSISTTVLMYA